MKLSKGFIVALLLLAVVVILVTLKYKSIVNQIAAAIQDFEDFVPPGGRSRSGEILPEGSRSWRNKNPGNLRGVTGLPGEIGLDETGHIIFDTYQSGWNALTRQVRLWLTGGSHVMMLTFTLYDVFQKYAEQNQKSYAEFVANRLGVSPSTTLAELAARA